MKKLIVMASGFTLACLILSSWLIPVLFFQQRTLPGLHLEGRSVGAKSLEALQAQVERIAAEVENYNLTIKYVDKVWQKTYYDLGIEPDTAATFEKTILFGKKGPLWERWTAYYHLLQGKANIDFVLRFKREKAAEVLAELTAPFTVQPSDASLLLTSDDRVVIKPAVTGRTADVAAGVTALEKGIILPDTNRITELVLVEKALKPEVSTEQLEKLKITGKVAQSVTRFNPANKERTHNIILSAQKLDNHFIPPGSIFSFNEVVGPRTKEDGYKDALIIVENEFEPGLGGGVCQVSSTLYNAALKANLAIKERRRHSLPVNYVPPGLDATVVYGYIDLKLQNNTDGYLWIRAKTKGDTLSIKLFGWKEQLPAVEITRNERVLEPQVVTVKDNSLPLGKVIVEQEGKRGLKVQVIRTVKNAAGEIITQEVISQDIYPAQDRKIRIGLQAAAGTPPTPIETIDSPQPTTEDGEFPER
ncbi:VanW family protein [Zhaonella formicivorans]|uniref:VanW family protein n=1 Tax=Zhaonella formicivorans TaxID=2528593 RepID=UPI0010DD8599|nr:VanW family protein [Zhaonella formicivorans]